MKKLLILDIDETLLHSTYEKLKRKPDFLYKARNVYLRPGIEVFLDFCFANFEVGVWTSARAEYARYVLKQLKIDDKIIFLRTRKYCIKSNQWNGFSYDYKYIKDLTTIIDYKIQDMLILDDTPQNITPIENSIAIDDYRGGENDNALEMIQRILVDCLKY